MDRGSAERAANGPVTPAAFSKIQSALRLLDQHFILLDAVGRLGDPNAHTDVDQGVAALDRLVCDGGTNLFGYRKRIRQIGGRQDDCKLLATVTSEHTA